ncbi:MAG: isoleucine--tRNA ligase [Nanoarchaeota archaeon]
MINQQEIEKEILEFWKKSKVFNKIREKNKGKKRWSFLDGPITANNPMGVHHAWGRTYKDLFQRFKAMQGFDQRYQNGFDCQGLWVEREEEKALGLKNKEDIEKFGVLNFVKACKARVEKFSKVQTEQSIRLGNWMDWDNSYYTMSDNNNLHNWYLIKRYFEKKWLYKGEDAVPWCPRCGTASSKHDIVAEGYKEVTHTAMFMQFPIKGKPDEYFIIFTTTPWTIPADVAIAVNKNINYVKVENQGVKYWIAESRLEELEEEYKIIEKKKGRDLKGIEYIMPYASFESQKNSPHKVVLWDLTSGDEGTGIVHIAPGCGPEDFDLSKKENLPAISPLDESGVYKEGYEEFSLKKYFEVNKMVLEDLEQRRFIYKTNPIKHRYPHCWRCGEELIFRLVDEWYIKCKEIREKLIKENKKVKWYPEYGKIRQGEWFKNMGDWLISRKRYWGLPLPIWECSCGNLEVIGSLKELREKAIDKKKVDNLPEIHRPWIDEIKIKCGKCKKEIERIKDVGDAWLDAGIVPFSTLDYLTNKEKWKKWFPADLISENMPGQSRGWFNALFWASVTITDKAPFKSLFGYETLKDENGEEMHKSKGNAIWFDDAVNKTGADPMRLLFCLQDPSQELKFGFNVLKEPSNNLNILYNISRLIENSKKVKIEKVEDKWILSKYNKLILDVTNELENLHPHLASRALQDFWLNDFSRGYIKFVRERLFENDGSCKFVLKEICLGLIKMCSPMIPFTTEKIWQDLREKGIVDVGSDKSENRQESVHLSSWPKSDNKLIDKKLEEEFKIVLEVIEKGLYARDKAQIGLKWPLASCIINVEKKLDKELIELIKNQLNVKDAKLNLDKEDKEKNTKENKEISVELDTKMTLELEAEGYAREISRKVQAARKNAGFVKNDKIKLAVIADDKIKRFIREFKDFIKERVNARELLLDIEKIKESNYKHKSEDKIKGKEIKILFEKI